MAKKESTFLNMVITLLVVTAVASFTLASVYNLTKDPIAKAREAAKQQAISEVVPEFDNIVTMKFKSIDGPDSLEFSLAYKNNELVGIAVATYTDAGFSGKIKAMVGFLPDGTIKDVVHLEHAETPGLGDKIDKTKSDWSNKFQNKNPENGIKVKKDGGEIDAITAATITSRAYCDAIERAYATFKANLTSITGEADSSVSQEENNELATQNGGE
ncbi:MAG: RnfABCDGE type electron transport complex subunit G [Bacteroidetes bacterium]|nr:RnfABCDGE type electron transport complex subunit G [Bacteroidota bacterium]